MHLTESVFIPGQCVTTMTADGIYMSLKLNGYNIDYNPGLRFPSKLEQVASDFKDVTEC